MNFEEYKEWTREVDLYPEDVAFDCYVLGLCSEAGEIAGHLKKEYRDDKIREVEILSEMGDVLWYLTRMCDEYEVNLEQLMALNKAKIESRAKRNKIQGDGDTR